VEHTNTLETYQEKKEKLFNISKIDDDLSQIDKYDQMLDNKLFELK